MTGKEQDLPPAGNVNWQIESRSVLWNEGHYRALFDNMSEGFAIHEMIPGPDGSPCDYRILDVNPAFERMTGLKRNEIIGKGVLELFPDSEPDWFESYGNVALTGNPVHVRAVSKQFDRWYQISAYRHANDQIAAVFSDITERKRAEKQIDDERKRFKDALDRLPAFVILLSEDCHVPFANRYFEERFGKSQGRRCFEYLFGRAEPCENCETYKVLKTKQPHRWEWTGPDNRLYDIYDCPANDVDGSPIIMEVGLDITEQRRAEKELRWQSEQLRTLTSQLTLAEQRERLRLAQALHDGLQQNLVAAVLRLSLIEQNPDRDLVHRTASDINNILRESIEMSRSLAAELSPPNEEKTAARMQRIRIVLADDHPVMRQGLADLLRDQPDMEIIGAASDGESVISLVSEIRPDVVLMDISMPGITGIEATGIIHSEHPEVKVIGLSMYEEEEIANAIRTAGAVNCLSKSGSPKEIIDAIRACGPK